MMPEIMEFLTRSAGMSYRNMLFALLFAVLLGVYIFFVYRIISKDSFSDNLTFHSNPEVIATFDIFEDPTYAVVNQFSLLNIYDFACNLVLSVS